MTNLRKYKKETKKMVDQFKSIFSNLTKQEKEAIKQYLLNK